MTSALLVRARATGYLPIIAQALVASGSVEISSAGDIDRGLELIYEAVRTSAEVGDDLSGARALIDLVYAMASLKQQADAGEVAYRAALAAVARTGYAPRLLAMLYHNRAYALVRKGDFATATALRIVLIPLYEKHGGASSSQAINNLGLLADQETKLGHALEAWPLFERALADAERALGPEHPVFEATLGNAAGNRITVRDFEAAARLLSRDRTVAANVYGDDSIKVASVDYKLGTIRYEERRLAEASELIERGIHTYETKLGKDHPQVAHGLDLLGEIRTLQGRPVEANELLEKAVALQRAAYGNTHPMLADTMRDRARVLLDLGRVADARTAVETVIAIDKKTIGENHSDHGDSLTVLGDVLRAEKKPAEAVPRYRRAAELVEGEVGPRNAGLAEPLVGLCEALVASGDRAAARSAAERALALEGMPSVDQLAAAEFCLAQAETDRALAVSRAQQARKSLAALSFPARDLPRIDRWLGAMGAGAPSR